MGKSARIALVGDVHLGSALADSLDAQVAAIFDSVDLVIANQESPICDGGDCNADKCCIRSVPAAADRLAEWGVDVA